MAFDFDMLNDNGSNMGLVENDSTYVNRVEWLNSIISILVKVHSFFSKFPFSLGQNSCCSTSI